MKKLLIVIAALLLISSPASSQENMRAVLAKQLAEVLGFENMLEGFKKQTQAAADQQVNAMMDQFNKSFPNIPPQFMKDLGEAASEFTRKTSTAWDAAEASQIYFGALKDALSEDEMRASIEHYRTPEGQKQLKAINEASDKLGAYILGSIQEATEGAMQEFIVKLKVIAEKARRDYEASKGKQQNAQPGTVPNRESVPGQ